MSKTTETIRKLLAQAEDRAGTPEGQTFLERAEEMMIRHGVERAMLDAKRGTDRGEVTVRHIWIPAPYAKQKSSLLGTVAIRNEARCIVHPAQRGYGKGATASVYGFADDLDDIEFLFTSLSVQAVAALSSRPIPFDYDRMRPMDPATFRAGWLIDFEHGVAERLERVRARATMAADAQHDTPGGADLVLRSKAQRVQDFLDETFPNLKRTQTRSSGSGRGDGYRAGQEADLGQDRVGHMKQLA